MKAKQKKEKRPAGTRVGSWLYPAVPPPAPQGGILDSLRRARWQRKRRRLSSRGSLGVHRRARWISERHIGNLIRSRQTQATSRGPRARGRERAEEDPAAQPCRSDGYASSGTGGEGARVARRSGYGIPFWVPLPAPNDLPPPHGRFEMPCTAAGGGKARFGGIQVRGDGGLR